MHFQHSHSIRACIPAKVGVVRIAPLSAVGWEQGCFLPMGQVAHGGQAGPGGNGVGSDIGLWVCRVGGMGPMSLCCGCPLGWDTSELLAQSCSRLHVCGY